MRRQILAAAVRGGALIVLLVFAQFVQAQTETTWTQLSPAGGPPSGRLWHSVVHDPATNHITVFGGRTGSGFVNDVWVLTNASGLDGSPAWMQLSPTGGAPAARAAHTAVYDLLDNRLVVFGGQTDAGAVGDVWVLTNADGLGGSPSWMQLSPPGGSPNARYGHSTVYDPTGNRMTVFGGFTDGGLVNDVWVLTNAGGLTESPAWMQLSPTDGPGARSFPSAVYDPAGNRMIVFGGLTDHGFVNDAWVLTNANGLGGPPAWTQLSPTGMPPSARFAHSAIYDPATNRMVVFGGQTDSGFANDAWVLTNANGLGGPPTWMQLSPAGGSPSVRVGHSAIYDPASNRMTLFGGFTGSFTGGSFANDTWVLVNANGIVTRTVAIDIKPGSVLNSINPASHGTIPVAVLSAADFSAPAVVDPASLTFGRTGAEASLAFCNGTSEDVNGDGLPDLVCHFFTGGTGFQAGDTQGVLRGKTLDGRAFEGTDSVRIID